MPERIRIGGWRKIAAATWRRPSDPQFYGDLELDATAVLEFVEKARKNTGVRVTVTHLVGKAIAHALGRHPDLNVRLYRSHFVRRDTVDIFFIVSAGAPLSPYYRIPFLALVGEVVKRPVVVDDEVVVRPMLTISATLDHRYLDGFHAARLATSVREYLADPGRFEPA